MLRPVAPTRDDWARPLSRRDQIVDAGVAAILLLGAALTIALSTGSAPPIPLWFDATWAALITLPLAWRRRFPIPAAAVVIGTFLAGQLTATPEPLISQIAPFLALYSVGAWETNRRRADIVRAIFVTVIVIWVIVAIVAAPARLAQQLGNLSASTVLGLAALSNALYLVAAVAFGETAWRSARRRAALEVRTAELQTERERNAAQAVTLERMRIARELHDVVAHHVSVISIQAGAARRVLSTAPDKASEALSNIEENARQAVDELHRTLEALRTEDPAVTPSRSTSTLGVAQVPELVADAERAGTPASFEVIGEPRAVTPAVGVTLYRVTQEALTNVRKHAGEGARAAVRLHYEAGLVTLEVADSGGKQGPGTATQGGLGQLGMRERVVALGGTFEAAPTPDGYVVRARIPA